MIIYDGLYPTIKSGWYRRYAAWARTFADFGGNIILIPSPLRVGWEGPNVTGMRYNPMTNLDFGQYFGDELQPGTAKVAQAMVRACAKVGIRIMIDIPGQYGGFPQIERNGDCEQDKNLAYIPHSMFDAQRDGTFEQGEAFGLRIPLEYSVPRNYLLQVRLECMEFLIGCFGAIGFRMDKGKDIWPLAQRLFSKLGKINVGEYYDSNNAALLNYIRTTRLSAFDFGTYFAARNVSQGAGLDTLVYSECLCWADPAHAVGFPENHDTSGPNGVVNFMGWFYFHLATTPMLAWTVYGEHYELYGLKPIIHNCMWIHTVLAAGKRVNTVVSPDVLIWYRDGDGGSVDQGPGVVCGINRDPFNARDVWTDTPFRNCWLKPYSIGGGPWTWAHADGRALMHLPPNSYGRADNYVALAPVGFDGPIKTEEVFLTLTNPLDFSKIRARYKP